MTVKRMLNTRERFELQSLVKAEYHTKGLHDPDFATYACERLGIEGINENHIKKCREDFAIPSTKAAMNGQASLELSARIERVEAFLEKNFPADWKRFTE